MKPITRILSVLIIVFIVCFVGSRFVENGLLYYNNESTARLQEILEKKTPYHILFIGSSRTHTDINPRIIDSICKVPSYNAGVDGGNLLEFAMIYKAFLLNHPAPKLLVLTLDLGSFNLRRHFFNYTKYFPFLNNKVIDSGLTYNGHNTTLERILPFLSITDFDDYTRGNAIKGLAGEGGRQIKDGEFQYKGYLSNTSKIISPKDTPKTISTMNINPAALEDLEDIIHISKQNHTAIIFTYAPEFNFELQTHISNSRQILAMISGIAGENEITYLRHDSLGICRNPNFFANAGHLNTRGASKYSGILAEALLKQL